MKKQASRSYADPRDSVGFGMLSLYVLLDNRLSTSAKVLYLLLLVFKRDRDCAWPDQAYLAQLLGRTDRTVRTLVDELVERKLIQTHRPNPHASNHYLFAELYSVYTEQDAYTIKKALRASAEYLADVFGDRFEDKEVTTNKKLLEPGSLHPGSPEIDFQAARKPVSGTYTVDASEVDASVEACTAELAALASTAPPRQEILARPALEDPDNNEARTPENCAMPRRVNGAHKPDVEAANQKATIRTLGRLMSSGGKVTKGGMGSSPSHKRRDRSAASQDDADRDRRANEPSVNESVQEAPEALDAPEIGEGFEAWDAWVRSQIRVPRRMGNNAKGPAQWSGADFWEYLSTMTVGLGLAADPPIRTPKTLSVLNTLQKNAGSSRLYRLCAYALAQWDQVAKTFKLNAAYPTPEILSAYANSIASMEAGTLKDRGPQTGPNRKAASPDEYEQGQSF